MNLTWFPSDDASGFFWNAKSLNRLSNLGTLVTEDCVRTRLEKLDCKTCMSSYI